MAFVDDGEIIFREIVEEAERPHSGLAAVEISGIVLDARAITDFLDHLHIICHALFKPLCLQRLALAAESFNLLAQVKLNLGHGALLARGRGDEDVGGIYLEGVMLAERTEIFGMMGRYGFDFIAPEYNPQHDFLVGEADVYRVAFNSESASFGLHFIAGVKRVDELTQESVAGYLLPHVYSDDVCVELVGIADTVKARHRRHHNDVAPSRQQGRGSGQAQSVDFVVDHQIFFDILVDRGYVCLRLIVIVI